MRKDLKVPKGWYEVKVGISKQGDLKNSFDWKTWVQCEVGIGCGNVLRVIRKKPY